MLRGPTRQPAPLHLFHDTGALPIGVSTEWRDDEDALRGVWRLDSGEVAQRAAGMVADGMLNHMSIRFAPVRSEWTYADPFNPDLGPAFKDHVLRTEARLLEVSLVTTPAYASATVEWVRTGERAITREATGREIDEWIKFAAEARAHQPKGIHHAQ